MATVAVIVQHGEKVHEPGDPALTERGQRQAEHVATVLARLAPAAVVSSPMLRARLSVQPLADLCGVSVQVDPRLRERLNLEPRQDPERFIEDWKRSTADRSWEPAGGRSSLTTGHDMYAVLSEYMVKDRLVVFASHGGATSDLLRWLLGDQALRDRAPGLIERGLPGAALTSLSYDGHGLSVDLIADVRHIPVPDRSGHEPAADL